MKHVYWYTTREPLGVSIMVIVYNGSTTLKFSELITNNRIILATSLTDLLVPVIEKAQKCIEVI